MSAVKRRSFSRIQRRSLLVLSLLLALLLWGLFARSLSLREAPSSVPFSISSAPADSFHIEFIPQDVFWDWPGWKLGGEGALQVSLGDGSPESAEEYIERMIAALSHDGQLVRVINSTSEMSSTGRWIARLDTLLLRTSDNRLDALLLLVVRRLDREFVTPYLVRCSDKNQYGFLTSISAKPPQGSSPLPFLNRFMVRERGFHLQFDPNPNFDKAALLDEYEALGFVSDQD